MPIRPAQAADAERIGELLYQVHAIPLKKYAPSLPMKTSPCSCIKMKAARCRAMPCANFR